MKNLFIRDFAKILREAKKKENKEKKSKKGSSKLTVKGGKFPSSNIELLEKEMDVQGFTNPFIRIAILSVCAKERGLKTQPEKRWNTSGYSNFQKTFGKRAKGVSKEQWEKLKKHSKQACFNYLYGAELPKELKKGWPKSALVAAQRTASSLGNLAYDGESKKKRKNAEDGDGDRFRGRGFNQLTGRYAYRKRGQAIGEDLESNPDKLEDPEIAAKVTVGFIKKMMKRKDSRMKFDGDDWQNGYENQEDANVAAAGANAGFKSNISKAVRLTTRKNKHFSYGDISKEKIKGKKAPQIPRKYQEFGTFSSKKLGKNVQYIFGDPKDDKSTEIAVSKDKLAIFVKKRGEDRNAWKELAESNYFDRRFTSPLLREREEKEEKLDLNLTSILKFLKRKESTKLKKMLGDDGYESMFSSSAIEKASGKSADRKKDKESDKKPDKEKMSKSDISNHVKDKEEGDKFRGWVNDNHPDYAKEIELDRKGKYNNEFIKKAWKKYGDEYLDFKKKNTLDKEKVEVLGKMKPYPKGGLDFNYIKIRQGDKKGKSIIYALSVKDGSVYARAGGSKDKYKKLEEKLLREVKVGDFEVKIDDFVKDVFGKVKGDVEKLSPEATEKIKEKEKEIKSRIKFYAPVLEKFKNNKSSKRFPKPGHSAYDWAMPAGSPYIAVADGKVIKAKKGNKWSKKFSWYGKPTTTYYSGEKDVRLPYKLFPGMKQQSMTNHTSAPRGLKPNMTRDQVLALINRSALSSAEKKSWTAMLDGPAGSAKRIEYGAGGNSITIEHIDPNTGKKFFTYCGHLQDVYVSKDQEIKAGQVLGTCGSTGRSTGPHFHWQLSGFEGNKTTDKAAYDKFLARDDLTYLKNALPKGEAPIFKRKIGDFGSAVSENKKILKEFFKIFKSF